MTCQPKKKLQRFLAKFLRSKNEFVNTQTKASLTVPSFKIFLFLSRLMLFNQIFIYFYYIKLKQSNIVVTAQTYFSLAFKLIILICTHTPSNTPSVKKY